MCPVSTGGGGGARLGPSAPPRRRRPRAVRRRERRRVPVARGRQRTRNVDTSRKVDGRRGRAAVPARGGARARAGHVLGDVAHGGVEQPQPRVERREPLRRAARAQSGAAGRHSATCRHFASGFRGLPSETPKRGWDTGAGPRGRAGVPSPRSARRSRRPSSARTAPSRGRAARGGAFSCSGRARGGGTRASRPRSAAPPRGSPRRPRPPRPPRPRARTRACARRGPECSAG
jgi:hypothetical protein